MRRRTERHPVLEGRRERILVVEDDRDVGELLAALLKSLGYSAVLAGNGPQALVALEEREDFELLLPDVVLPGGTNGLQLAEEAHERCPSIRVLYMSGYTQTVLDEVEPEQSPPVLLRKPFTKVVLARALREALNV